MAEREMMFRFLKQVEVEVVVLVMAQLQLMDVEVVAVSTQPQKVEVVVVVVRKGHIVVEQQHIGHAVGTGVAVGIDNGGDSWNMMVVKMTHGAEIVRGES
ncbi:unnamed protein product, partial [Urochloa humidicola]